MNESKSPWLSRKFIFGGNPPNFLNLLLMILTVVFLASFFVLMSLDLGVQPQLESWRSILINLFSLLAAAGLLVCLLAIMRNIKSAKWFWLCVSLVQLPMYFGGIFVAIVNR